MIDDEIRIGRKLVSRSADVGLMIWQDPVTGMVTLPQSEVFPSLLVALEQIKALHLRVTELEHKGRTMTRQDLIG